MVNVIEKTQEETDGEEKYNKLEGITKKVIKGSTITHFLKPIFFPIYKGEKALALVHVSKNYISLDNQESYDEIVSLAEDFELETERQWTIQKNYKE